MVAASSPPVSEPKNRWFLRLCKVGHNRKAWLFADTPAGTHASAMRYSLMWTAKRNGLKPYTWVKTVLENFPRAKSVDDYNALLLWSMYPISFAPTPDRPQYCGS